MSLRFAPRVREASTKTESTERTPDTVLSRIGKNAPKKIIKAADLTPIPNQKMARGIQASGGIGLRISTIGFRIFLSVLDQPISIPIGTAKKIAIKNPQSTRCKLANICVISL